jgi:hypothetical protein
MAPQASKQGSLLPPDQHRLASCTSNGTNSEQVSGTFSAHEQLWIAGLIMSYFVFDPQGTIKSSKTPFVY